MKNYEKVKFAGKFRDYQQGVLDRAQTHLRDGRIHIVAAPGSGKTVLGLELIRRLKAPALVLSPSVTIRQQWGERFAEKFLPDGEAESDYVSYDLKNPSLITSVTYQSLHAAVTKQTTQADEGEDEEEDAAVEDYTGFDIFELLKTTGIKTICLDEAHHLKSEWQKALEKFIEEFKRTVKIIALTATPPYDGTPAEWSRYISLCGEIDEEISVPQLVVQKTLCPHQDFIYFSYPTRDECLVSENYKINGIKTSEQILDGGLFKEIAEKSEIVLHPEKHRDIISQNTSECAAVAACIYRSEGCVPRGFLSEVCFDGSEKKYDIIKAEKAFGFIIANPDLFSQSISESLRSALAAAGLIHKNRVCLVTNDKITRQLISSSGKLQSINRIVSAESENLGKELRMLILTDYIKRDMIKLVGTNEELNSMGTVPVFESVRRSCGDNVSIAMLSGSMVIIPDSGINEISEIADSMGVEKTLKKIENTGHAEIIFSGSNKNKVSIMTAAFQKGLINVLIGTKSLLGEGWDSPCINSLILASFVGSFMLSNQMRGRAIRTDYNAPDKVSNIWHLITVEPEIQQGTQKEKELYKKLLPNENGIGGSDFATLKRRFDCFLAPAYNYESVESGIERLDIIKAPFDEKGIADINEKMLSAASERKKTAESWISYLHGSEHTEILDAVEIKNPSAPKNMAAPKLFGAIIDAAAMLALILLRIISDAHGIFGFLFTASIIIVSTVLLARFFKNIKIWKNLKDTKRNVTALIECVKSVLFDIGALEDKKISTDISEIQSGEEIKIHCAVHAASVHDKKSFSEAAAEAVSAIDSPRYVAVKTGFFGAKYYLSYACPSVAGNKKENAERFSEKLKSYMGKFTSVYTRNENGLKVLSECRKNSYLNAAKCEVKIKKIAKATQRDQRRAP